VFVFRFCIEFIKNPQEAFEKDMMFNMGQWLSVPFIVLGVISLFVSSRVRVETQDFASLQNQQHKNIAKPQPKPQPEKKAPANHRQHNIKPKKKKK